MQWSLTIRARHSDGLAVASHPRRLSGFNSTRLRPDGLPSSVAAATYSVAGDATRLCLGIRASAWQAGRRGGRFNDLTLLTRLFFAVEWSELVNN